MVSFDNGVVKGIGIVKGVTTTEQPVIGCTYVLKVLESDPIIPSDLYPFSHLGMFEVHMTKMQLQ